MRATSAPIRKTFDRFLRKARSVAQLRFLDYHDSRSRHRQRHSLVCDFEFEGITLADHRPRLTFVDLAKVIAEVADGLQYAHSLGVVHRDVKPSNIMMPAPPLALAVDFAFTKVDAMIDEVAWHAGTEPWRS